ncbi:MAG: hypothetical protein CFH17_01301 [Alphaproteobacteria bacterium MarineAlpha5_Bin7]|nr:MAG: hypothetical protein CFH17_01301 [Alphaproteobacteria bacterium MarineAlpha5_Bin7]|tara:strand:- start:4282 stop:4944 length:663 start_codon:yes stop_codon:yes gene_type:complete
MDNLINSIGNNAGTAYDQIFLVLTFLVSSLVLRQAMIFSGQNWIKTYSHTVTLLFLPIITYAITSVISDNIALSLGMVGALSIVRFRNPVKSPLELVIYFAMISIGIAGAVSYNWLLLIVVSLVLVLVGSQLINNIFTSYFNIHLFTASFTEGNSLHTLEIRSNNEIEELSNRNDLINFIRNDDGSIVYMLANHDKKEIMTLANLLKKNDKVVRIAFNAA